HWKQYPPNTTAIYSYLESRGGMFPATVFFGLQYYLRTYLQGQVFTQGDIAQADDFCRRHFGRDLFNRDGWTRLLQKHGGCLPVRVRAVPEGSVVSNLNVLSTIENTDSDFPWLTNYLETLLLKVWYPTTVATLSREIKKIIKGFLERTGDPSLLPFKLHDFGSRGVSSVESAAIGGAAHLVNFLGTDTVSALRLAQAHYHEPMAGFSIPAAEHSTITSWGREHEVEAYRNMLRQFAKPGSVVAVVSDSYDIYHAIREHWGRTLKDEVIKSGATLVVRPDSGDPVNVVHQCVVLLDEAFGHTVNGKGYKVLNHVRVIQGDGINPNSIRAILERATSAGYATDNLAFGMGG